MRKLCFALALLLMIAFSAPSIDASALVGKSKKKASAPKHRVAKKSKKKLPKSKSRVRTTKKHISRTKKKLYSAPSRVGGIVTFTGRGYGHGVGMTQYGAEGMAEKGYKYANIIKYYYTDVDISNIDTSNVLVRVALLLNSPSAKVSSSSDYTIINPSTGETLYTMPANSTTTISVSNGNYLIENNNVESTTTSEAIQVSTSADGQINLKGNSYLGTINILKNSTNNIDAVNVLSIENYLRGVVPSEISAYFKDEAIKAQVLAARTYALREIENNTNNRFDVYDSVLSQVYRGESVHNSKIDTLIDSTKGEVITYKGELINALFSASAGGYTVDASFVWGTDVPYLKGKPDPFDKSVYASNWWKYSITRNNLDKMYPQVGTIRNLKVISRKFNRPTSIQITGSRGNITVTASSFRNKLKYTNIASAMFAF